MLHWTMDIDYVVIYGTKKTLELDIALIISWVPIVVTRPGTRASLSNHYFPTIKKCWKSKYILKLKGLFINEHNFGIHQIQSEL